jgi:hypothetical protein
MTYYIYPQCKSEYSSYVPYSIVVRCADCYTYFYSLHVKRKPTLPLSTGSS